MSYIYKVLEHLKQLWMGKWQHTHTVTTTEVTPDLGELAEIIDDVSVEMIPQRYRLGWQCRRRVGDFSPKNNRHADMLAQCCRHDTDHVGDIAPCRLVRRHVGVVSARVNCDVSAPCRRYAARA